MIHKHLLLFTPSFMVLSTHKATLPLPLFIRLFIHSLIQQQREGKEKKLGNKYKNITQQIYSTEEIIQDDWVPKESLSEGVIFNAPDPLGCIIFNIQPLTTILVLTNHSRNVSLLSEALLIYLWTEDHSFEGAS